MEKLCIFCKHFKWENPGIGPDYSEYTGGDAYGGAGCEKGQFSEERPIDEDEMRELYLKASSCPDYSPPSQEK